jgi:winged helix DNA-binding protein
MPKRESPKATTTQPAAIRKRRAADLAIADRIRLFRWMRQGMAGALKGSPPDRVIEATGWIRSVGGASPYLALRDRAGISRADVDRAVAKGQICELPSARGCTYVVPRGEYALALRAGQGFGDESEIANAKKFCGVTDKELDKLSAKVLDAIEKAPLDPNGIKEAVGDAVRSLGPEGKKRGLSTTLPLVLGKLQSAGEIRRVPVEGRLDRQRYKYARWTPSPLAKTRISDEERAVELARRYFRWAGPARIAELAWWAGLGVKAARAATAALELIPVADGDDRLLLVEDREMFDAAKMPADPVISFVGLLDNIQHPRREVASLLDERDAKREIPGEKALKAGGTLMDLPYHPIIDRGRLIGLWDYDGVERKLVHRTFEEASGGVAEEANAVSEYVESELEDVRSFSLDSPAGRADRIEALERVRW